MKYKLSNSILFEEVVCDQMIFSFKILRFVLFVPFVGLTSMILKILNFHLGVKNI